MSRIALTGGDYQARSLAASAQRTLNLIPEPIPQAQGEPALFTYYPTPGLTAMGPSLGTEVRALYANVAGLMIAVVDANVYSISTTGAATLIGPIGSSTGPVQILFNDIICLIVDGSNNGWYFTPPTGGSTAFSPITEVSDPAFYGSGGAGGVAGEPTGCYLLTFFILVRPNTNQFYVSPSNYAGNSTQFDGTYIAAKTTSPDAIQAVAAVGQNLWIFGVRTSELWYVSGASDFPLQINSAANAFPGCASTRSVASNHDTVFWLAVETNGDGVVYMGKGYQYERISTYAIEQAIGTYVLLKDAIGQIYQQEGHTFYVLTFPTADVTWVYDTTTGLWHQRCYTDAAGNEHRVPWYALANFNLQTWVGDYTKGQLYLMNLQSYADNGQPVTRIKSFPHLVTDSRRAIHRSFTLDMTPYAGGTVAVDWSDDRGQTYGTPLALSLGDIMPTAWRLGLTRDRIYRVSWTGAYPTMIQAAFLTVEPVAS